MSRQKVVDSMITGTVSSSKLEGALPAISGANITGVGDGVLKAGNDPALDTNPAAGVGAVWLNTSSGEMFVCTDATADANVWTNIGEGTGDVEPWAFGGTTYGYTIGGYTNNAWTEIQRFSLVSDGGATTIGNVAHNIRDGASIVGQTHGYCAGSETGSKTDILKFAYANDTTSSAAGNLSSGYTGYADVGSSSSTHGYVAGGWGGSLLQTIDKYSFASEGTATAAINMTEAKNGQSGHSDLNGQKGFLAGGLTNNGPQVYTNKIEQFSYANDNAATNPADLSYQVGWMTSSSSTTHGYTCGGCRNPSETYVYDIHKFAFSSTSSSSDLGDLDIGGLSGKNGSSASSTTHGYYTGGAGGAPGNLMHKYSYEGSANSTDVGDLATYTVWSVGNQV